MTNVRFFRSQTGAYTAFETWGHAGHGSAGNDIVCAAVSASTELVISILEQFSIPTSIEIEETAARVYCSLSPVNDSEETTVTHILDGYRDYLLSVSKEYPKHLKCTIITE